MDAFWKIGFWERQFLPIGCQEEKFSSDVGSIGNASWCVGCMEFVFWFLNLRGFGTVSNGLNPWCHICLSSEFLWRVEDLCMHPQFTNIL